MHNVGQYDIEIVSIDSISVNTEERKCVFNRVYIDDSEFRSYAYRVKVYKDNKEISTAIIGSSGGNTVIRDSSFVCKNDRVIICCSNYLFCLSIPGLSLIWKTEVDLATCFQVFEYGDDYIVHGELNISRVSSNGDVIWQYSGTDIFVTSEADGFILTTEYISAKDFQGNEYKIGYDGNDYS